MIEKEMDKVDYTFVHRHLKINGFSIDRENLVILAMEYIKDGEPYRKSIGNFLLNWLDDNDYVEAVTSGSTGIPKVIRLKKQHMVNSALATGKYLNLSPKNTALLCLPADFIAGKMMIIRAIVLGLHLDIIQPSSMPLALTNRDYDFTAMIPLQASKSLYDLHRVKKLILGGAAIDNDLEAKLQNVSTEVYSSYGMTETISHIAMRHVNHTESHEDSYKALPGVTFRQDERKCLVINAPQISDHEVITNDIVRLISDTEFIWLGRLDNVINSGGFKVFPESVERKIKKYIKNNYFIIGEDDDELGQRAVLYVEGNKEDYPSLSHDLYVDKEILKYEVPRVIYFMPKFELTGNGKIQRKETVKKYKG
ncbi:Acyl-CoA synthetase (AMP-forming)/AMP-acid ligase II-like protein [Capnocytophaga cynodegmi]|uniref:Acyl-CoA synthetase (AMP-forming)/AMP-acid ligase II-like protein n=2 Tax=Capnocytophaga cynodegmi TaxID=28189 RepID=A0A0B7HHJ2_9FLAO|nr:Acyl-CoA synthetase (AMP-forming)/AMP-acid ligase II-like protein [Capnocytophaga cynodegmi]